MSSTTNLLTDQQIADIQDSYENEGLSQRTLAQIYGVSKHTIQRAISGDLVSIADVQPKQKTLVLEPHIPDEEVVKENVRLAKQIQKQRDLTRIERKSFREYARVENAVEEFCEKMAGILESNNLSDLTVYHDKDSGAPVGVVHLSDLHFNEQVHLDSNIYNFDVAARRIRKHVARAKALFAAQGVDTVLVAFTGDLLNSDRRLDELLENATNRSKAVFLAVDILQQAILDLNTEFNVFVASITGNEGRVNEDLGWIAEMATDNYDLVIHQMLKYLFRGSEGVKVLDIVDPLESVVNLGKANILLIHGHTGIARTAKAEPEVAKLKARYAAQGVKVDYVIFGHIHSAYVSDFFARSGGLPGSNAYSEKALNLQSKASQNLYVFHGDGSIDGYKIDLQNAADYEPYKYDTSLESYNSQKNVVGRKGVVIHKIVV